MTGGNGPTRTETQSLLDEVSDGLLGWLQASLPPIVVAIEKANQALRAKGCAACDAKPDHLVNVEMNAADTWLLWPCCQDCLLNPPKRSVIVKANTNGIIVEIRDGSR